MAAYETLGFNTIKNSNVYPYAISTDLNLPTSLSGAALTWSSSDVSRIATDGLVSRPAYSAGESDVNLSVSITSGDVSLAKDFPLTVSKTDPTDLEAVTDAYAGLTFASFGGDNHDAGTVVFDLHLPLTDSNGVAFDWNSSNSAVLTADGNISRSSLGSADSTVELNATITKGSETLTKGFTITVLAERRDVTVTYDSTKTEDVHMVEPMNGEDFNVTVELGSESKAVYFVITNNGDTDANISPVVTAVSNIVPTNSFTRSTAYIQPATTFSFKTVQRGSPEISRFNASVHLDPSTKRLASTYDSIVVKRADVIGDTDLFYTEIDQSDALAATCRKVVNADGKSLNIWVATNVWGNCSKAHCVTQTMVDAVADRFLKAGEDNDIYNWVSGIYGEEWETSGYPEIIGDDNNITILLLDIGEDNSEDGGIAGYFFAKDNFKQSEYSGSNERIMFYLDSVMLANPEDADFWSPDLYMPSQIISTLAHEFQHMIHFYQKQIKYNLDVQTDTWIDEMCSMMAEDFTATKLQVDGPRGIAYSDGTGNSTPEYIGFVDQYNYYNFIALTDWLSGTASNETNILNSYAIAYSFGSYLGRNFGGVELFKNIVDNDLTDEAALTYAMSQLGYDENLSTLIPKWGAANLLSDRTDVEGKYRYNAGDYFVSKQNGITYRIGSINLFNYQVPPTIFDEIPTGYTPGSYKRSNLLLELGSDLTGSVKRSLSLLPGYQLTVVIK